MKIVLINSVCGSGSTGRIVADLWRMLKDKGYEAKVAYGLGEATLVDEADTFKINNRLGYYVHNAMARITDKTGFYSTARTKKLVEWLKKEKPDLIHLHNLHGFYLNIRVLFEYLATADIPVVWTLHDCWPYTGHCAHYMSASCEKWKTECNHCELLRSYPQSILFDRSRDNYNDKKSLFTSVKRMEIVTPSQWLANEARQSFLGKYDVQCIYNGIDLEVFKPTRDGSVRKRIGVGENEKMVLSVANVWNRRKGLDDILELANRVGNEYKFVIVGLTDDQLKELPDSVIGIKRTGNLQELTALYSTADVLLNPSYEETMGMVTAEALACGTPVCTYDQTAVPEIADEKSGTVVHAGDIDGLVEGIKKAVSLKRDDAIKRAQRYEKTARYEEYYSLYAKCLAKE